MHVTLSTIWHNNDLPHKEDTTFYAVRIPDSLSENWKQNEVDKVTVETVQWS